MDRFTYALAPGQLVIEGESADEFAAFRQKVGERFTVEGVVADFLIGHLAGLLWRLRRTSHFEAGLLSWISHQQRHLHDGSGVGVGSSYFTGDRRGLDKPSRLTSQHSRERLARKMTGRTLELSLGDSDLLGKLGRYEAHLLRQAERTLVQLRLMQKDSNCMPLSRTDLTDATTLRG